MHAGHGPSAPVAMPEDRIFGFTVPGRDVRGRVVRLGPTLNAILHAHAYPDVCARILAEALTVTAMLGAMMRKDGGEITVQAQSKGGPIELLVCDYRAGAVRGYLQFDPARAASLVDDAPLETIFGKGYLAITLEQSTVEERYQGIVPLEGPSLSRAFENYFSQSEQIPTLIRTASAFHGDAGWSAGGLIVQHFPRGEEGQRRIGMDNEHPDWEHVRVLCETVTPKELCDNALPLEELLWRLFHEEEVRVLPSVSPTRGCRCSPARIRDVILRFPADEIAHMRGPDGKVSVDCAFCARSFPIDV